MSSVSLNPDNLRPEHIHTQKEHSWEDLFCLSQNTISFGAPVALTLSLNKQRLGLWKTAPP